MGYWITGVLVFFGSWAFRALELYGSSFASARCVDVFRNETYVGFYVKKREVREDYLITNLLYRYHFDFDSCSV